MRVLFGLMQNSAAHSMCFLRWGTRLHFNGLSPIVPRAPAGQEIVPASDTACTWIAFFRCHADSVLTDAVCFGSVIHTASTHATHKNRK